MNFEDKLQVQLKIYNVGYVQIGSVFYDMKDSGEPDFDVKNENVGSGVRQNQQDLILQLPQKVHRIRELICSPF